MRLLLPALFAGAALAQQTVTWEERPGLRLSNDKIDLTVLTTGGAMVELTLRDDPDKLSPLWNPVRMAR